MAADDAPAQAPQDGPARAAEQSKAVLASAASPAPSTASSQSRPHYTPQFSATTEMILKRIRGEPNNLSSTISSASAAGAINKNSYEDAKRRLVMSMNTSISLPMPASAPVPPPRPAPALSLPKNEVKQVPAIPAPKPRGRPPKLDKKGKVPQRGTKRKRGKEEEDASSALSEPPESEEDDEYQNATPTTTKSGRQVSKPVHFNPVSTSGSAGKRKHYGKRTAEQALCKVCTRGLSPINNQVVFCDGCNLCWHQMCHDPYIDDEFVSDESRSWFCRACLAKREKHLAKKKNVDSYKGVSWASKPADQKRTYLSSLPHSQLVNLVMYGLELHPDLPVFPDGNGPKRGRPSAGSQVTALPATPGPVHFTKSASTPTTGPLENGKMGRTERERSEDVPPAWPKVGSGVLAGMNLNEDDFEDKNDFESFSVATFDARTGKKVVENGMPVSSQEAAA